MVVDLLAATLNSILYSASLAASPKGRPQSKQRKKTLPVWNEIDIACVGSQQEGSQNMADGRSPI